MLCSVRGSKTFGMARSNMDKKKADEEIRKKEAQLQDLAAKYKSLQASHMKIVELKDELEEIYSSKSTLVYKVSSGCVEFSPP